MQDQIDKYRAHSFREIETDSGVGSRVFVNKELGRAVKFNQDPAYDKFAEFARSNPQPALPVIHVHTKPLGEFKSLSNDQYTVTELELLAVLSAEEQQLVEDWVKAEFASLRSEMQPAGFQDDPYDLRLTFNSLRTEAARVGVHLDVLKGSNFMKRGTDGELRVVFIDPFA
ncbi:hypothetical protein LP085_01635 [Achromobacter sp. MY14]|uniref:hypothetical protein n=1 Tax=unclassified Achromobacter TaxID=2626865 RepID=UPI001E3433BD|nr:hypothetical protein [Achromobacter sp. MY14]MCD0495542.1 hypothetical protein [Achromobacter sp. MY14]